jgi:hypothetical protein
MIGRPFACANQTAPGHGRVHQAILVPSKKFSTLYRSFPSNRQKTDVRLAANLRY